MCQSLKKKFSCDDKGEVDGCLGLWIRTKDGMMILKQPQLSKIIFEILSLKYASPKGTPSVKPILNKIQMVKIGAKIVSIAD